MRARTLQDQKLGVRVVLFPLSKDGKWAVTVRYRTSWHGWYTQESFNTPPMRTVNALQVLRATFEMHRMRKESA